MKAGDYRYTCNGDVYRVVIAGDVIALPDEYWSGGNYGEFISEEWLVHSGCLPSSKGKRYRLRLARLIRRALADHHEYELEPNDAAREFEGGRHAR